MGEGRAGRLGGNRTEKKSPSPPKPFLRSPEVFTPGDFTLKAREKIYIYIPLLLTEVNNVQQILTKI